MLLELAEVLACPRCGPPQNVVVVVHRQEGRRVREGFLGCPACGARMPVREGTVRMQAPSGDLPSGGATLAGAGPGDRTSGAEEAEWIAALLAHRGGGGVVLLGLGLEAAAGPLTQRMPGTEVMALIEADRASESSSGASGGFGVRADDMPTGAPEGGGVSRLEVARASRLPVLDGRCLGVALSGEAGIAPGEAARVLRAGGRLVVLRPGEEAGRAWDDASLEWLAGDERALVARRL